MKVPKFEISQKKNVSSRSRSDNMPTDKPDYKSRFTDVFRTHLWPERYEKGEGGTESDDPYCEVR